MTCNKCGMTICWDCECDPELNALIAEAEKLEHDNKHHE